MATFRYSADIPEACREAALTIGNFDGVHLGHQALLAETRRLARALGCPAVAVTFDPHPAQVLRPDACPPLLTPVEARTELLHFHGADHVLIVPATPALLRLTAQDFFDTFIVAGLRARALVEGHNFTFGKNREGTAASLKALCAQANVPLTLVAPQTLGGRAVSSSLVRQEILQGAMPEAAQLLGRPFRVQGLVRQGDRRGATLGFPTANLEGITTLIPGPGVYACHAWHQGQRWAAAANVGSNPTFGVHVGKVEVHLLNFTGDLYGLPLAVDFLAKIREVRKFASATELREQIQRDVEQARALAETEGPPDA